MFYDGLFLVLMLGVVAVGLIGLWRMANRARVEFSNLYLAGGIVVGAGIFDVFDGVVNHYVLDLHDVVHDTTAWNPHWVAVSLLLLGAGVGLLGAADGPVRDEPEPPGPSPED